MTVRAGDFDYGDHGRAYSAHRRTEPRIAERVHDALGPARTVLNVGAGTGSYEPADRYVVAVEPSAAMRAQRSADRVPAIDVAAEQLPFDDGAFDSSMAICTIHQWRDFTVGLRELRRVTIGPVVILTFDPDALDRFWLAEYTAELIAAARKRYPAIDSVRAALGGNCVVVTVNTPLDCVDGFVEAYYGRPEQFLDPGVRQAQSAWGFVTRDEEKRALDRLHDDLRTGEWERRHGELRTTGQYAGALRLVVARPA